MNDIMFTGLRKQHNERIDIMTNDRQTKNAASEGTSESPCSPASEGFPEGWRHCTIHLNWRPGDA